MTPEAIRHTATALHDEAMDPAKFRGLLFNLAAEAVAQVAEMSEKLEAGLETLASQQRGIMDAIDALTEEQAALRELSEKQAAFNTDPVAIAAHNAQVQAEGEKLFDPIHAAAYQLKMQTAMQEAANKIAAGIDPASGLTVAVGQRGGNHA
jgi:uncharacterized phage infection (PIP) family protein YhgE